jgi:hypothetical protein
VRGSDGLEDALNRVQQRTVFIVGYIGEWHSHPPFYPARPSGDDCKLIQYLADVLKRDGDPALMVIVGSANEMTFSVRDAT